MTDISPLGWEFWLLLIGPVFGLLILFYLFWDNRRGTKKGPKN